MRFYSLDNKTYLFYYKDIEEVSHMKLRELRLKSNLKIKGICETLGVSRSTYYLIEVGKRELTEDEQLKLDKLFSSKEVKS